MVYSYPLLTQKGVKDVILISSGTHVRRGAIALKGVLAFAGEPINIKTFAYMDKTTEELKTEANVSQILSNSITALGEICINLYPPSADNVNYDPNNKNIIQLK